MILYVKVKPGAKEEKIEKISETEYLVLLKARPEKGKANEQLIKIMAKELNVSQKKIEIKNPKSRKKIIKIL